MLHPNERKDNSSIRKRGWKKPILERGKAILNDAEFYTAITGDNDQFLRDLISLHPEAESKIGVGVSHFEVRPNEWNKRTFWLVRTDGTATDFSYIAALTPPTPMQDFAKACRNAIKQQIVDFKAAAFANSRIIQCTITGEDIAIDTSHVDHAEPATFDAIVKEFAATRTDIAADVLPTQDGDLATTFRDPETESLFAEFHRVRAVLRIVSKRANLSLLRKKPQT